MHRSHPWLVKHAPGRVATYATAVERRAIAATYELHDRVLSNRRSRGFYARSRPSLDDTQLRIVRELDAQGYSVCSFRELSSETDRTAVEGQAAEFIAETEAGLREEAAVEITPRRGAGKEFLVRKYDAGAVLALDDPWLRVAASRRLLDVANAYLGMWSKLEYVDLWYSIPQPDAERTASQLWHRDFDDRHLLKAFLYLSDVDEDAGPFEFVPGSQPGGPHADLHPWAPMAGGRVPDEEVREHVASEGVMTFTGARGTVIFCNTSGLHRGGFAQGKPRVLATATYCSPASLAALTERSFTLAAPGTEQAADTAVRYALS
jgi:Phytanoyl-CoA dioxygenase (PhyH)